MWDERCLLCRKWSPIVVAWISCFAWSACKWAVYRLCWVLTESVIDIKPISIIGSCTYKSTTSTSTIAKLLYVLWVWQEMPPAWHPKEVHQRNITTDQEIFLINKFELNIFLTYWTNSLFVVKWQCHSKFWLDFNAGWKKNFFCHNNFPTIGQIIYLIIL